MSKSNFSKKHCVHVFESYSSFVRRDHDILAEKFTVLNIEVSSKSKFMLPLNLLKSLFQIVFAAFNAEFMLVQGGGYHSLITTFAGKLTGTKVYIIVIGTDAICLPEIDYGHFNKKLLGSATGLSFRLADCLLPVHSSLIDQNYIFDNAKFKRQGITAFVKGLGTPIKVVNNGFDYLYWYRLPGVEKIPRTFLTVASVQTRKRYLVKGIDLFLQMASKMNNSSFTLVGSVFDDISVSENVILIPHARADELRELYSKHEYYVQLSRSEGFPNALCEAMLCECIPIVSNVGGQADIIGSEGILVDDISSLPFLEIGTYQNLRGRSSREVIVSRFSLANRKSLLLKILNNR